MREQCKVVFAYKPTNEDELDLKEGDIITILSKDLPDKGWWKGELKGKVGVFPDNFVQLISPDCKHIATPFNMFENTNCSLWFFFVASPVKDSTSTSERALSTSKLQFNNNNNTSSNSNGKRIDSFGSKDSLNDSGIITGNVAAYRKSLESKLETTIPSSRKSIETKTTAEIRKSLENLDERKSTPPPVLTKKPIVPMKKSPTVGSVAGNIFSGLKPKAKNEKITHHDSLDGIGASKMHASQVADNNEKGISGERLRKDDLEFDQVERVGMLQDMRAGRAKAPKRRLPTSNSVSLSDTPGVSFENGDAPASPGPLSGDDNKSDEDVTKPKPREWEKNRAPWMDELKASQAKKTSPGIEASRSPDTHNKSQDEINEKIDISKTFNNSSFNPSSNSTAVSNSSHRNTNDTNNFELRSNSVDVVKKENDNVMAKSMSSMATKISISDTATTVNVDDTNTAIGVKGRPTSVTLRNVNMPPIPRLSKQISESGAHVGSTITTSTATILSKNATTHHDDAVNVMPMTAGTTTTVLSASVTSDNVCSRVVELELRVQKLEKLVQKQNVTIEELLRTLKDESDKVKTLKHELDKYAQCVTQV